MKDLYEDIFLFLSDSLLLKFEDNPAAIVAVLSLFAII